MFSMVFVVPWTWERESRGQKPKSLKKSRKSFLPKVRKKVSKKVRKVSKTPFSDFCGTVRTFFEAVFRTFWTWPQETFFETFGGLLGFWPRHSLSQVHGTSSLVFVGAVSGLWGLKRGCSQWLASLNLHRYRFGIAGTCITGQTAARL